MYWRNVSAPAYKMPEDCALAVWTESAIRLQVEREFNDALTCGLVESVSRRCRRE